MASYSEIIQTVGAMIIFSFILLSTNRYILSSSEDQIISEVQMHGVSITQDFLDRARLYPFDRSTLNGIIPMEIPDDFESTPFSTGTVSCSDSGIESFSEFDQCFESYTTGFGNFLLSVEVYYVDGVNFVETAGKTRHKEMRVTVTNDYLNRPLTNRYLRSYNH